MTTVAKLTVQSEISLEQLYQLITQLTWKQRLKLADDIKREALREQWQVLSDTLPNVPELSEDEILAEVKATRKNRENP